MTVLTELPQAVVAAVNTGLPALKTCRVMEGRFDEGELARVGARTPAVLIARLGAVQHTPNPAYQIIGYRLKMAAFVVTSPSLGAPAADHQDAIATYLLGLLPDQMWGLDDAGPAENIAEQPVVTSKTRANKVLITAITWDQPIALTVPVPGVPVEIGLYFSQSPAIGSDHVDDYDEIGAEQ